VVFDNSAFSNNNASNTVNSNFNLGLNFIEVLTVGIGNNYATIQSAVNAANDFDMQATGILSTNSASGVSGTISGFAVGLPAFASGATFMSLAGSKRLIRKNAFMLIHELRDSAWGKYTEIKDNFNSSTTIMKTIKEWYAERSKVPPAKMDEILSHDMWWNAKTCIKYGLVDQII
jgi:hypothetical protein